MVRACPEPLQAILVDLRPRSFLSPDVVAINAALKLLGRKSSQNDGSAYFLFAPTLHQASEYFSSFPPRPG